MAGIGFAGSGGAVIWNLDVDDKGLNSGLDAARNNVKKAADDVDNRLSKIGDSTRSMSSGIVDAFKKAEGASWAFAGSLGALGATIVAGLGFGVKMAADIETARQGFTTLLGSIEKADAAIAMIKKDAATTPFEFSNLVRANQMLTSVTKNASQSERLLLNVGKALSAAGKGSAELDNVIVNLQQIANTAHISEMDVRQFGFAGINILELLADHYGTTKEAAADMVKNSKDAFSDLESAFAKAGENGGKFSRAFIDQAGTMNQLWSNFRDIVSQTAAELVTKTGIFDMVKMALGGIIDTLVQFQPQIVQGIKDFMTFITENGPIIVGVIAGGLTPAFVGLAVAVGSALISLLPFMAIGAVLAIATQSIVTSLGGWQMAQEALNNVLNQVVLIYDAFLKPAIDSLWLTIQTQLIPELQKLWTLIGPILTPILKIFAGVILGIVLSALIILINIIHQVVIWVSTAIQKWNEFLDFMKSIPETIRSAFSSVYNAITEPFNRALNTIRDIASRIKESMDNINPFHRNSPSLVDNVKAGVALIADQYKSLGDIKLPSVAYAGASFKDPLDSTMRAGSMSDYNSVNNSQQNINIHIDEVNELQNAEMISRQIGFQLAVG